MPHEAQHMSAAVSSVLIVIRILLKKSSPRSRASNLFAAPLLSSIECHLNLSSERGGAAGSRPNPTSKRDTYPTHPWWSRTALSLE
eukprot:11955123-Ditylum_brightwellii.AAC.1